MAGAPSPDRPVVLRRLGIVKDPNDAFLQESRTQPETPQDALELFATEAESTPRVERWLNAIRPHAAWAVGIVRRNPMFGVVVVAAVSAIVGLWAINRFLGSEPSEQRDVPVAASADTSTATSHDVAATTQTRATTSTNTLQRAAAGNANAARSTNGTIARGQQVVRSRLADVPTAAVRPAGTPPQSNPLDGPAPVAPPSAPAAAPVASEATAAVVDDTIYSEADTDVAPPQTSEILPGPTFSQWTTRTNAMEVIVSETGAVERVRLVTPPQRMPDILMLSRAKVWKFKPAMKDGRPVRYRLLLKWEVNP
jgi:hypothetical protein